MVASNAMRDSKMGCGSTFPTLTSIFRSASALPALGVVVMRNYDAGVSHTYSCFLPQSKPIALEVLRKLFKHILTLLPKERITYFETDVLGMEEVTTMLSNLELLHLYPVLISDGSLLPEPRGPNAQKQLIPSTVVVFGMFSRGMAIGILWSVT